VPVFPHDARMRNLTYSTEVFADIKFTQKELDNTYETDANGIRKKKVKAVLKEFQSARVLLGKVPVMLRSSFC
jgi:DNA-directed RNA polymerase II subunit RPB2